MRGTRGGGGGVVGDGGGGGGDASIRLVRRRAHRRRVGRVERVERGERGGAESRHGGGEKFVHRRRLDALHETFGNAARVPRARRRRASRRGQHHRRGGERREERGALPRREDVVLAVGAHPRDGGGERVLHRARVHAETRGDRVRVRDRVTSRSIVRGGELEKRHGLLEDEERAARGGGDGD